VPVKNSIYLSCLNLPVLSLATTASGSVRDDSSLERSEVAFSEPKVVGLVGEIRALETGTLTPVVV
jgi:hypothetical protein